VALELRILGPFEALADGRPLRLGGAKQRALLAVLLLRAGEVVSSDRLIDELWGAEPPPTAAHTVQVFVSRLRKALEPAAPGRLLTRPPGYVLQLEPGELDLERFETLLGRGRTELERGDAPRAAELLREALALWRGPALADFAYEPFAQSAIARLEELRLAALEERIEADLAAGGHGALVGELEAFVAEHPLRERLRGQLMLALYRSGRQAEALEAFQDARRALVDELGIDPSPALQRLERAILQQDPALDFAARAPAAVATPSGPAERSILLVFAGEPPGALVALAEPLAGSRSPHELILTALVPQGADLAAASASVNGRRSELHGRGIRARATAFVSADPAADVVRLASVQGVDLALLAAAAEELAAAQLPPAIAGALAGAPCDVAVAVGAERALGDGPLLVPFGGTENDWAALELGAWLASARGARLRLLGSEARDEEGRRDASRLLALAALSVAARRRRARGPALLLRRGGPGGRRLDAREARPGHARRRDRDRPRAGRRPPAALQLVELLAPPGREAAELSLGALASSPCGRIGVLASARDRGSSERHASRAHPVGSLD
jgi:DNA-binding SARP family transcriptional activator